MQPCADSSARAAGTTDRTHRALRLCLICHVALLYGGTALAQSDADPTSRPEAVAADDVEEGDEVEEPEAHHHDDTLQVIVVTASPVARSRFELLQSTSVLADEELDRRLEATLGDTLRYEPGIKSSFFGQAAGRPVIRGQDGIRLRILQDGVVSFDASDTSPDHAVAEEPLTARRIEVIRGPAVLRYGSQASGGVVNVMTDRIPVVVPEGGYEVDASWRFGTNGARQAGHARTDIAVGDVVFHADGFFRRVDDYSIPGYAESKALRDAEGDAHDDDDDSFGVVENSDLATQGGGVGVSWIGGSGHIGASASILDSEYGVPGGHGHDDDMMMGMGTGMEPEALPRIDLRQWRVDIDSFLDREVGPFRSGSLRFGYADYLHRELEGDEVATRFFNDGFDARVEAVQKPWGALDGAVGLSVTRNTLGADGDESFVPTSTTRNIGLFAHELVDLAEWDLDGFGLEAGVRYENQVIAAENGAPGFDGNAVSVSGGATWEFVEGHLLGVTGFRNERFPVAQELYSDGPHLATGSFDLGDPSLGKETAAGVEVALRRRVGALTGGLAFFYTSYEDYIYRSNRSGLEVDGLPLFQYVAEDANFIGGELDLHYVAWERGTASVGLDFGLDYVRARLDRGDENLPRIPPLGVLAAAEFQSTHLDVRAEVQWADSQTDIAPGELPTDSYTLLNLSFELRPIPDRHDVAVFLRLNNLTDADARLHTSSLKDVAPLPGRDIRLGARIRF